MVLLNRPDGDVEVPDRLPVIALRDLVFFPHMVLPLLIGRPRSTAALDEASGGAGLVFLVTQRHPDTEDPGRGDLFDVGSVARVVQVSHLSDGTARVVLEGLAPARLGDLETEAAALRGGVALLRGDPEEVEAPDAAADAPDARGRTEGLTRDVLRLYAEYARLHEHIPDELPSVLSAEGDPHRLAHLVSGHMHLPPSDKQELLEADDLRGHLALLRQLLQREIDLLRIEAKLDRQLGMDLDDTRIPDGVRPVRLLGPEPEGEEWAELESAVRDAHLPPHARERAQRELARLRKLNPVAPEAAVIRSYVEWITSLPWSARSTDNLDVARAARVLDEAHYGLEEVKERILDHVAVLSLVGELRGPILCLVGPPGVGKTSLGRSIADALDREFVRVSLGGVRDEAEIRGHRRTYVGALPGRVIQGMRRSGTKNPVFLLDEVDKLARDFHGDPGAALLEVLDPEQNRTFTDHYLELEYDLSDVLFVATANTLQGIPEPLRDRMEVIRLPGYLDTEKKRIAREFLWPRQARRHGLDPEATRLADPAIQAVIGTWTREAGVRELDRRLSRVARKLARRTASGGEAPAEVEAPDLPGLLGPPAYQPPDRDRAAERIGIANALAWTEAGGAVLDVEVAIVPGSGRLRLTGTLGDVMKESAQAAVTYARSRSDRLGLEPQFHDTIDVHIHIPEGATPKDGPSAGITIAVALISALVDVPTRADVALTGEITLRGRVLGVGGVKEKAVAALRGGIRTVVLPAANESDLLRLPEEVSERVRFVRARTMDEVLDAALAAPPTRARSGPAELGATVPHA